MKYPHQRAANAYRTVDIESRTTSKDPYELVAMSYEVLLERLAKARGAIEQGDTTLKIVMIDKAIKIIQEGLRTALDMQQGGEIAANLDALYEYSVVRLTQANATNNAAMVEEVANLFRPLADAWRQLRQVPAQRVPEIILPALAEVPAARSSAVARMLGSGYGFAMMGA